MIDFNTGTIEGLVDKRMDALFGNNITLPADQVSYFDARLQLKVKYKDGMEPIFRGHDGEWFDLRADGDYCLVKGDIVKIGLGVAMELPEGYEAHIQPRSCTAEKFGMMMACSGVIDNRYNGDNDYWNFMGYVIRSGMIHKNDRICQFRLVPEQPHNDAINIVTVDKLGNEDRGGFGSTGIR